MSTHAAVAAFSGILERRWSPLSSCWLNITSWTSEGINVSLKCAREQSHGRIQGSGGFTAWHGVIKRVRSLTRRHYLWLKLTDTSVPLE